MKSPNKILILNSVLISTNLIWQRSNYYILPTVNYSIFTLLAKNYRRMIMIVTRKMQFGKMNRILEDVIECIMVMDSKCPLLLLSSGAMINRSSLE